MPANFFGTFIQVYLLQSGRPRLYLCNVFLPNAVFHVFHSRAGFHTRAECKVLLYNIHLHFNASYGRVGGAGKPNPTLFLGAQITTISAALGLVISHR